MKSFLIFGILASAAFSAGLNLQTGEVNTDISIPTYPSANFNRLNPSPTDSATTNNIQFGIISNAQQSITTPVRSIDSLFTKVPSSYELDQLVLGADAVAILKTVQTLVSNDALPCDQILAYLLELLGRIRTAIQRKEFGINQLQIIIDGAKAEIARLQAEIARLEEQKVDLWLDEYRDRLTELVAELEPLYKQFNEVENQIAPNEARIAGFQKEIELLRKSNSDERNRIANDRLEIASTAALIRDLRSQLMAAEQRQAYLEASVSASLALIAENDKKIADAQANIKTLEAAIRALRDQGDALRSKISTLEIQVERLRNEIIIAEIDEQRINSKIEDLRDRIAAQERLLVEDDLAALQRQVQSLRNALPTVQDEVNRQYFYCFGDGAFETAQTGGTLVYIIRGEAFQALLENTYGISFDDIICCDDNSKNAVPHEIEMMSVDIFSDDFTNTNGDPFVVDPDDNNGGNGAVTPLDGSFSCIIKNEVAGRGVIIESDGNRFTVRRYSNAGAPLDDFVEIAPCTIIMATVKVPRAGMSMAFTGALVGRIYQANMITVW